jgi:hypothetical protein
MEHRHEARRLCCDSRVGARARQRIGAREGRGKNAATEKQPTTVEQSAPTNSTSDGAGKAKGKMKGEILTVRVEAAVETNDATRRRIE